MFCPPFFQIQYSSIQHHLWVPRQRHIYSYYSCHETAERSCLDAVSNVSLAYELFLVASWLDHSSKGVFTPAFFWESFVQYSVYSQYLNFCLLKKNDLAFSKHSTAFRRTFKNPRSTYHTCVQRNPDQSKIKIDSVSECGTLLENI